MKEKVLAWLRILAAQHMYKRFLLICLLATGCFFLIAIWGHDLLAMSYDVLIALFAFPLHRVRGDGPTPHGDAADLYIRQKQREQQQESEW